MTGSTNLGTAWRSGLPPGVYEDRPTKAAQALVRMDVAAFVGLTERGPVDQAVAVQSFDEYRQRFGAAGGGRLLAQSVYLFFANGGRRCVVVRAVSPDATPAVWTLANPVLGKDADGNDKTIQLAARDPGAWGGLLLRAAWSYTLRAAPALPAPAPLAWPKVALSDTTVLPGAVLRLVTKTGGALSDTFFEVLDVSTTQAGVRVATLGGLSGSPAPLAADQLATLQEVRLAVTLSVPEATETFVDLGLSWNHPRYALDVLRGDPDGTTGVGPGSLLVTPIDTPHYILPFTPGEAKSELFSSTDIAWAVSSQTGDDAAATTARSDFFQRSDGSSPFDLLDPYNDANEANPVSMICLPDLIHPLQVEAIDVPADAGAGSTLTFGLCTAPAPPVAMAPVLDYPLLALSYNLFPGSGSGEPSALEWQSELVARCDASAPTGEPGGATWWGRIAILDLPPGLAERDVLRWRSQVQASRGVAALYAPYLRCAPVEDPLAPLLTTPPCGAVAGIVARRENAIGVHAAPANEVLQGVAALFQDGRLPDAGFLHQARVDLIRPTANGFCLLGSRTTSDDPDWTHVSVRRIVHWLERQIALDTRWATFEPNDRRLWSRLTHSVRRRLDGLFTAGALAGASRDQSYFIKCDASINDPDSGKVVVQVGVAPAVPAEFIVFELSQLVDGSSLLQEQRNG